MTLTVALGLFFAAGYLTGRAVGTWLHHRDALHDAAIYRELARLIHPSWRSEVDG